MFSSPDMISFSFLLFSSFFVIICLHWIVWSKQLSFLLHIYHPPFQFSLFLSFNSVHQLNCQTNHMKHTLHLIKKNIINVNGTFDYFLSSCCSFFHFWDFFYSFVFFFMRFNFENHLQILFSKLGVIILCVCVCSVLE